MLKQFPLHLGKADALSWFKILNLDFADEDSAIVITRAIFFDLTKYIFDFILAKFWLYFDLTGFAYYLCLVALFD